MCCETSEYISYVSQKENTFSGSLLFQEASGITEDVRSHYSSTPSPTSIIFKTNIRMGMIPSPINK
jgi:hypothetical protein